MNAYVTGGTLTTVYRGASGIHTRRQPAEHSMFVRAADLTGLGIDPDDFFRRMRNDAKTAGLRVEGDWLRVMYPNRDVVRAECKWFESPEVKGKPKPVLPTYEGGVSPVLRHMVDNRLCVGSPRRVWFDLETDSRVPFTRKEQTRILCWCAADATGLVARGMLNTNSDADERRVVGELLEVLDAYDQVLAWGGDRFDFPVLESRAHLHGLMRTREWKKWLWLDHLEVFKRMNVASESGDEKASYKLDVVGNSVLGEGKTDFPSDKTWEAWDGGRRGELLAYCEQDTLLMPKIEAKTGYVELLQTIAETCGTLPDSRGTNPSVQVEGFLTKLAHEHGFKFPTVLKRGGGDDGVYAGAYVLHPQPNMGVLRNVHVADFASLYPSIIRTWNMSPETLLPKGTDEGAYSPLTGEHFRTDKEGMLSFAVGTLVDLRKEWNERKAALPPGTPEWVEADRMTTAYKVEANSFYGVVGAPHSRFYNRRVAESVTQCGKWLILETIKEAERQGMQVVYGDTDSLFVVGASRESFAAFVQHCNENLYPRILRDVGCQKNHIKLTYEKEFRKLVFTKAKRYVGSYEHYKGAEANEDSKPEIKGLEFKRGDSLRMARELQREVAYKLVGYHCEESEDPEVYADIVRRWMAQVLTAPLELDEIRVSKTLNKNLEDYKTNDGMVRIAKELRARGRDVSEGTKVQYIITNAAASPQEVIPAEDWTPETYVDREAMWDKHVFRPTLTLLEAIFPGHSWAEFSRLVSKRKRREREIAKTTRDLRKTGGVVATSTR